MEAKRAINFFHNVQLKRYMKHEKDTSQYCDAIQIIFLIHIFKNEFLHHPKLLLDTIVGGLLMEKIVEDVVGINCVNIFDVLDT